MCIRDRDKDLTDSLPDGCSALMIPNAEIREIFETTVSKWFDDLSLIHISPLHPLDGAGELCAELIIIHRLEPLPHPVLLRMREILPDPACIEPPLRHCEEGSAQSSHPAANPSDPYPAPWSDSLSDTAHSKDCLLYTSYAEHLLWRYAGGSLQYFGLFQLHL